jgi:NADH-quinone oxidoreductase subunit L
VSHPSDVHAHGQAQRRDHEVSHGPAEPHDAVADATHSHAGHGAWHGPHESPSPMTMPLQVLAVGAIVAGFVGLPPALGFNNAIEHYLEPSFTPTAIQERVAGAPGAQGELTIRMQTGAAPEVAEHEEAHASRGVELGLMAFSLLVAISGIMLARKFYVTSPEVSERLADQWSGAHRVLSNKYYVDEFYDATVISGTFGAGRGLWAVDRNVVDGAVNGTGWATIIGAWFSGLTDRTIVDGIVNLVGRIVEEGSFWFRRIQTGLVQNYAMVRHLRVREHLSVHAVI